RQLVAARRAGGGAGRAGGRPDQDDPSHAHRRAQLFPAARPDELQSAFAARRLCRSVDVPWSAQGADRSRGLGRPPGTTPPDRDGATRPVRTARRDLTLTRGTRRRVGVPAAPATGEGKTG